MQILACWLSSRSIRGRDICVSRWKFYEIADAQNLSIVFDTDAKEKLDQYVHLGVSLAKTRELGDGVFLYDLYRPAQGVEW